MKRQETLPRTPPQSSLYATRRHKIPRPAPAMHSDALALALWPAAGTGLPPRTGNSNFGAWSHAREQSAAPIRLHPGRVDRKTRCVHAAAGQ